MKIEDKILEEIMKEIDIEVGNRKEIGIEKELKK